MARLCPAFHYFLDVRPRVAPAMDAPRGLLPSWLYDGMQLRTPRDLVSHLAGKAAQGPQNMIHSWLVAGECPLVPPSRWSCRRLLIGMPLRTR